MAQYQYYDPLEAATTFRLFSKVTQTQREEEKEEKERKGEYIKTGIRTPWQMLEGKRAEDLERRNLLLTERDQYSVTGRKYKPAEYTAPERGGYDPRRLKDWFNKRYGRSGEERVEYEERTPEGKQLENIKSDPDFRHGIFDPEAHRLGMEKKSEDFREVQRYAERKKYYNETLPEKMLENIRPLEEMGPGTGTLPPIDPEKGTIAYDELTAKTWKEASDKWGRVAETRRREIEIREGIQGQSTPEYRTGRPLMQHRPKAKSVLPGGVISEQIGKPLIPEIQYGSFDELVRARNAARGTEGLGVIQEQVSQYMPKGTSYGEASKAFDAAKTATETTAAVETGGKVIGVAGETAGGFTPGISEAMAAGELAGIWGESGGRGEDKIKATAGTAFDYGTSAMIASGNPYAMVAGGIGKAGKAAWEYLA
jgi:hypothetical protein